MAKPAPIDWTKKPFDLQQFKGRLVAEVKKRPMLYDSDDPAYKDKAAVEDAWNEVVDVLDPHCNHDISIDFAKKHWKALRDDFFRRYKKLENNELTRDKVLKWPLFLSLEFLKSHYKKPGKQSLTPRKSLATTSQSGDLNTEGDENPEETTPKTGAAKRKALVKPGRRSLKKIKMEKSSDLNDSSTLSEQELDATNNNISTPNTTDEKERKPSVVCEEEEHYARSIAATLRRFNPKVRSLAKAKIQQLLFELEFGEPSNEQSNGSQESTKQTLPVTTE